MRLTYQTGVGTLIQFLLLSFLTLGSQAVSAVTTCSQNNGDCVSNLITSIIFYILVAIVFGAIWLLGYSVQSRRSKRLAQLLIAIEVVIALGALFSIKISVHQANKNVFALIVSFLVLVLAAWIITLAFRLMRAGGGRVVVARQRRHHMHDNG
jgi:uncharacterized membrane protein YsdA (DUF1294 family)